MKKFLRYSIPIVSLIIFVAIMTTGGLLKKPFHNNDNFRSTLSMVRKDVKKADWKNAKKNVKKLNIAWHIVEKRIQFSVERNDMNSLDLSLARLNGAISIKDSSSAYIELSEMAELWKNLEG